MMAAAGGSIAKAITKSFWGKLLLFVLFVIFFPFIIWTYLKEYFAVKKTMKDLHALAISNRAFDWLSLKMRASEVFMRVQTAWDKNNIEEVSDWMDDWYWQNQKYVHLEKWEENGQKNIVKIKKIKDIKPLYVQSSNTQNAEDSRVILSIEAEMQDYLVRLSDNMIVEGDKEFKDVESVWTFIYKNGKWVVQNIEEGSTSLVYAKMENILSTVPVNHQTA
jgi:hypothetical protein